MIEKLIVLEDIDPVIFYGVNNANMQLIKALYPKLRIVARGNVIKVLGDEERDVRIRRKHYQAGKILRRIQLIEEEGVHRHHQRKCTASRKRSGNVIVSSV